MKQLVPFALLMLGLFLTPIALAADPDNYDYRSTYTVANAGASAYSGFVCAPVNIAGLSGSGFMEADALDSAAFDTTGSTEHLLLRTSTSSGDGCFFTGISVNAGQSIGFDLHTGGTDNLAFPFSNVASASQDLTFTYPGGTVRNASFVVDDFTASAWPSTTMPLGASSGGYQLTLSSAGLLIGTFTDGSATCTAQATLTLDVTYDIEAAGSQEAANSPSCYISLDGSVIESDNGGGASNPLSAVGTGQITGSNTSFVGTMARWRFYQGTTCCPTVDPTLTIDYDFLPANVTTAADGPPVWTLTVADQAGTAQHGTYTVTANTSNITVTASPLRWKTALDTATVSTTLADLTGTLPSIGSATASADTFSGDDTLVDPIAFMGLPMDAGWFLFAFAIASAIGIPLVRLMGGWVGAVWMGFAMGVPATDVLNWYGWVWVAIGGMMCFGAAGVAAYFGKR